MKHVPYVLGVVAMLTAVGCSSSDDDVMGNVVPDIGGTWELTDTLVDDCCCSPPCAPLTDTVVHLISIRQRGARVFVTSSNPCQDEENMGLMVNGCIGLHGSDTVDPFCGSPGDDCSLDVQITSTYCFTEDLIDGSIVGMGTIDGTQCPFATPVMCDRNSTLVAVRSTAPFPCP